jgi:hypothetical protein
MLRFFKGKMPVLRNEAGSEADGGFDFEAASDQIGAELGLGTPEHEEVVEHDDKPTPTPAPAPAAAAPTPTPAPTPAPTAAPAATPAPTPAPQGKPRFTADAAPTTWKPHVAQHWAAMPQEVREEIARRESDMFTGLEQYKSEANFAREIRGVIPQDLSVAMQQHGVTPQQFIGNLVNAHMALSSDRIPMEQKVGYVQKLLQDYGIKLGEAGQPGGEPAYVDPEVAGLRQQIAALESRLNGADANARNQQVAKLAEELDAFAKDPANPYFDDVAEDVALIIRAERQAGRQIALKDAYEKAVWANPATRAKETARLQAETEIKVKKEAEARAAAARKASGARVPTSGHQGGGTAPTGSMEDTMAETLRTIRAKEARS